MSALPIPDVVAFLTSWDPGGDVSRQTVTALAQELRTAVANNPEAYAAEALRFVGLKPIYVRQILEGLAMPAINRRNFAWGDVLRLIAHTLGQFGQPIDPATMFDGDDRSWTWACMKAAELLAAGLRQGAGGIDFEHAALVRSIILALTRLAPRDPEIEDFEERYKREPFFAAQAVLRGLAVELCVLLMFWLSNDPTTPVGAQPRQALANSPEIRDFFESELLDQSPTGRIPRAVMGRYLSYMFFFGEEWLKGHFDLLFPPANQSLRRAAWHGHLGHDQKPIVYLVPQLRPCFEEEIAQLASNDDETDRDWRRERFADFLIVLHLWDGLPDDLLESFWAHAPIGTRQHAMWYLGTVLEAPDLPEAMRARGFSYWERRLAAAVRSANPDVFRVELGAIGQWCLREQIDDSWLADKLFTMLGAGFVPTDAFSVVDWLAKIAPRNVDRAVEILSALLRNPRIDQWAYMTQQVPIRTVLSEGLARGTHETVLLVKETIGFLSSIGETSYLDLVRPSAAE
jgi:hypothetical protein